MEGTGRLLLLWLALLVLFWAAGASLALQSLALWDDVQPGSRVLAMAIVLLPISLLSYVPVLLYISFIRTERERARDNTTLAIRHQGWHEFEQQVNDWYDKVFINDRYPVPVTLALVTFLLGWTYFFFRDGPAIINDLATEWQLQLLVQPMADGQPVIFAFLGAYFFSSILLFRRYIIGDLGPAVFIHVCMRTWTVVILALVATAVVPLPNEVLSAAAFLGGVTPSVLLDLITDVTRRGILNLRGRPDTETSLTALQGMNAWKAARLAEEGIDNVQNLAMDDPSKLVVITQESGMRILDWIDQALLYNYVRQDSQYQSLTQHGVRTSYDLYLLFRQYDLITEEGSTGELVRTYRVDAGETMSLVSGFEQGVLRNILLGVLHHPNFEKIRQMREKAQKTAGGMFKTLIAPKPQDAEFSRAEAPEHAAAGVGVSTGFRQPVAIHTAEDAFQASGTLVTPDQVLTIYDVDDTPGLRFYDPDSNSYRERAEDLSRWEEPTLRLAVYRLAEPLAQPVSLAEQDPKVGSTVNVYSLASGMRQGLVTETNSNVQLFVGRGDSVLVPDTVTLDMPASPGDGGAPIYNQRGELVATLIGGNSQHSIAIPGSRIRQFLGGTHRE